MDLSLIIGGQAGQGMDTFASLFEKTMKRCGYNVYAYSDYMSRIRGGHNFFNIRISSESILAVKDDIDILFALDEETIKVHKHKVKDTGIIIADESIKGEADITHLKLSDTARKLKNPRVINTIGLGAILKYLGVPVHIASEVIREEFNEEIANANLKALEEGYRLMDAKYHLDIREDNNILINGNEAVALGAIAAGCKFYCGYPMTPSTGILNFMARHADEFNIAVDQVEDEVAALNMALGASYAGVRAMTGSSGGGFALMVEALSLAGIIEVPVVLINVQRPGPATGFPTRTEQADLRFMIHAGHGEFPRMVIALRDTEDAFYQTIRAFNIAEKYNIPVLLISDQHLADGVTTKKPFNFRDISIERNIQSSIEEEYKTYRLTESGISPRIIPGKIEGATVLVDSDEHDEYGHITESGEIRTKMVDKRLRKFELLKEEINEPWLIGDESPENLVVCWGSTYGAVKEAVENLKDEGISIGTLVFGDIWPFPTKKLLELNKKARKIIDVEQNATAQLDSLIREEALIKSDVKILKYDGRPFTADEVYRRIKEVL
ncbi:MAG TPA: 2-oxoacid:acceptor oxidoreductase subunit alpha [Tissierellia bacterium]|nr:2-oxoacid:acceptor oxidoreductase subunit alpha [Tissierellia bacterium]